jgi:hypothetical protein
VSAPAPRLYALTNQKQTHPVNKPKAGALITAKIVSFATFTPLHFAKNNKLRTNSAVIILKTTIGTVRA